MKKLLAALLLLINTIPVQAAAFIDTENSWYTNEINELSNKGVITGYEDGSFKPKALINRAEFLTLLMRSQSTVAPIGAAECFRDITADAWYTPWVCAAKRRGIISGYSNDTFKPDATVNFAEAIKIVARMQDDSLVEPRGQKWFEVYTQYLHNKDILSQYSYIPWANLTRERAADLLYRQRLLTHGNTTSRRSVGCGKVSPSTPPSTVTVQDVNREFLLRVPSTYRTDEPLPIIFAFHGRTNSAEMVRNYYRLDRTMPNAIIVYPKGVQNSNGTYSWSAPNDSSQTLRDVEFFDEMLRTLQNQYCIDTYRVYAAGHSLGGWFSNSLGCIRGDVIRATASVGSSGVITRCQGPAAGIFIHNPNDRLASVVTGERARNHRLEANSCSFSFTPAEPRSLLCEVARCDTAGNPVYWCPHQMNEDNRGVYYPHNWPKNTGQVVADFFNDLP